MLPRAAKTENHCQRRGQSHVSCWLPKWERPQVRADEYLGSARQEKRARTSGDSDNPGKGCRPRGAPS